ncbi:hypothetical protein [Clostridium thailandense]|uniref:hypothetical protein n=1 Tax=Clostridium thailandense TaxID=2794346 RepID=UPI003989BC58
MASSQSFNSKKEMINFISDYLIAHKNTIVILNRDLQKDIIKSLLIKEDFDKFKDVSSAKQDVLLIIKTGNKIDRTLGLKVCDAHNQNTKNFKMIDIENVLVVDGLITEAEEKTINYYEEMTKLKLEDMCLLEASACL